MFAFDTLEIRHLPNGTYEVRLDTSRYILSDEAQLRKFLARIDNRGEPALDEENIL